METKDYIILILAIAQLIQASVLVRINKEINKIDEFNEKQVIINNLVSANIKKLVNKQNLSNNKD